MAWSPKPPAASGPSPCVSTEPRAQDLGPTAFCGRAEEREGPRTGGRPAQGPLPKGLQPGEPSQQSLAGLQCPLRRTGAGASEGLPLRRRPRRAPGCGAAPPMPMPSRRRGRERSGRGRLHTGRQPPAPPQVTPDTPGSQPCRWSQPRGGAGGIRQTPFRDNRPCGQVHCPCPRGQGRTDMWSLGGAWPVGWKPHKCQSFLQLFPFSFFFIHFSQHQIFFCGCHCHLVFKKKSHLVLVFCRHRHRGGTRQTQTCDRQAVRPGAAGLQTQCQL